ncbi:unnamed protein product, partial [Tilletia caries]
KALSIPLPPDYCDRPDFNIGVGEAWAFELAVHAAIAAGARSCVLLVHVDNQGVVYALRRGRSRNQLVNEVIDRTSEYALSFDVELSVRYVRSEDNPADAPSRGDSSGYEPLIFPFDRPWESILNIRSS